jgi:membrane protease YdiL (CAAX protease family)
VFSPVLLVLLSFRLLKIDNPIVLIASIWIGNLVMLGLVGLGIRVRGESWKSIGLPFKCPTFQVVAWTFLKSVLILIFAVAAFIFGSIVMANLVGIPEGANMTQYDYMRGNLPLLLLSLAGVYIVSSFGEEVVYRGFLMTRLQTLFGEGARFGVVGAVAVSSIVFGFAHFEWGAMGIGQTTCMGAALAISFLWTRRNLWPLVLAHACMDTLLLVQLFVAE